MVFAQQSDQNLVLLVHGTYEVLREVINEYNFFVIFLIVTVLKMHFIILNPNKKFRRPIQKHKFSHGFLQWLYPMFGFIEHE